MSDRLFSCEAEQLSVCDLITGGTWIDSEFDARGCQSNVNLSIWSMCTQHTPSEVDSLSF